MVSSTRAPKEPTRTNCACGSKRPYSNCCARFHNSGRTAEDPVDLIRARYSAYAYRMPGYIMRTTDKNGPEWKKNQVTWEEELLQFCDMYKFKYLNGEELGIELQECT